MKIALKAVINQRYISAEYGGGVEPNQLALTANREEVLGFETFEQVSLPNGCFALQTHNGNYITADVDGSIRSNAIEIGAWENFSREGNKIKTFHGTYLTARIDKMLVPIETTENKDIWEEFDIISLEPIHKRGGLVRANGKAVMDDVGMFHPLGITFFWALYGWRHERERIYAHLDWLSQFDIDYLRILGEVDWEGRSILPFGWPDYQQILADYIDYAYDECGIRTELTVVGGHYQQGHESLVSDVLQGRHHKIMHLEVCNEYERLDKISRDNLVRVGKHLRQNTPNLVALSTPNVNVDGSYEDMIHLTKEAGANMYSLHTRRSDHDNKWSHVRQGYDLKNFPGPASNNEPQGPQSSVKTLDNPMQLAMARACGVVCNGAFYVLHVGQGVTGKADANHGRPENMWEVPNIDTIIKTVKQIEVALPDGIENWKCVNNGRDDHPMPLPDDAFWEGSHDGAVNKNYACINGNKFVEVLLGVKSNSEVGNVGVGKLRQDSVIKAIDGHDARIQTITSTAGTDMSINGRKDTMAGYVICGNT